ncbi:MAG: hypothetical protein BMS9Abin25_0224 [Gammaproteobacteria bacterium]|nr:MAG: hypothetical protein BMS9Abin25_0224 [Gammaproteobacteria bacterium]
MKDKAVLEFVGRIYDAALLPERWNDVLDELAVVLNAASSSIQVLDPLYSVHQYSAVSSRFRDHTDIDELLKYYFDTLWKKEQKAYEYLFAHTDQGFLHEYVVMGFPDASYLESHEPTTWMREHFNLFHRMVSRLNITNAWQDSIAIQYDASRPEPVKEDINFANLFLPHIAKAIELGREFTVLRSRFNAVLEALDYYQVGTIIVTQNGDVILSNEEAKRVFEQKDGLSYDLKGRLSVTSSGLLSMIKTCAATARGEGVDSEKLLAIKRRSGKDDYILTVAPMRDPQNSLDLHFRGAIVYVVDPTNISIISTAGMAKLYDLTKAEDAVCQFLVEGLDTQSIADRRSVSIETIRSQIKSLMSKTRVQNRASLIRLALSVNLPIENPA